MEILSRKHWAAGLAVVLLAGCGITIAGEGLPHWLTVITADQLRGDVTFLASEELAGRAVLSPGSRTAAAFIASRFDSLGLKPAGEGDRDWYQRVPLLRARVHSGSCRVERRDGEPVTLELVWGDDFRCRPGGFSGFDLSGEAVFAGYGIHAPDRGHDDFAGIEAKGRILVVLAGSPDTVRSAPGHCSMTAKRAAARSHGARALLVLPEPGSSEGAARLRADFRPDHLALSGEEDEGLTCPAILLQEEAAARLVSLAGIELVPGGPEPHSLPGIHISCTLQMEDTESVSTRNVLGLIPGSDELRFREFIIVSAHYDHLGSRSDGRIFPGADDNASGVAAMIAAARALAALPVHRRPARSILFIAWAGEERGFLGSEHFGGRPTVPRGQIKTIINLDMVGRNNRGDAANSNTLLAIYSAQVPGLETLLDEVVTTTGLELRLRPRLHMGPSSDHVVFHRLGIPALHFFSGVHQDYNGPGDTADRINFGKLLKVSQTTALLAFQLADEPDPPLFDETITTVQGRTDSLP